MDIVNVSKDERTDELVGQLTTVWEGSVRATHLFLSNGEIENIKQYVPQALKEVHSLMIVKNRSGIPIAFMGVENNRLEMLFVGAQERKKGIGTKLIQYGIEKLSVNNLTVNEQNPEARRFYESKGFKVFKRAEVDEQGNPYPVLYMKL